MGRLNGKVAFLSGATSGIGKVTAEMFALEGAKVIVAGHLVSEGEAVVQGIRQSGGEATFAHTDVREEESVRQAMERAAKTFGRLDVLFNSAGGSSPQDGPVTTASLDEFWNKMKVDLWGTFLCCRFGVPELIKAGGGSIINMSSMMGLGGVPGRDAYTSAKGAVIALTRSMAREFVAHKIRVNAIAPGAVSTERILKSVNEMGGPQAIFATQVLGFIEPAEIGYAAIYLASDEARSLTGETLAIHGGTFGRYQ